MFQQARINKGLKSFAGDRCITYGSIISNVIGRTFSFKNWRNNPACFQSVGNWDMDIDNLNIVVSGLEMNGASLLIKYPGIPSGLVNLNLTFTSAASTSVCEN